MIKMNNERTQYMDRHDDSDEPIEFGSAGSMMEGIAEEKDSPILADVVTEDTPQPHIVEVKEGEIPPLPKSTKPEFNPEAVTHGLKDDEAEGGISTARSASQSLTEAERLEDAGGRVISQPNMDTASMADKYEITGFTVEVSLSKGNMTSIRVRDYFDTLEDAMASVSEHTRYMMPVRPKGFKVTKISSGAPILCFNERELYNYLDGQWRKT
jgi:hypothetical protein